MRSLQMYLAGMSLLLLVHASQGFAVQFNLGELPANDAELDLSIPESPAFAVLGLSPESVVRPATPRQLAASLLNGIDANGNFQTGMALDTVPFLIIKGDGLTIQEYRKNPDSFSWTRFASRSQLSFATTKGTNADDPAVRAAIGVSLVPFDLGDPRQHRDLDACFTEKLALPDLDKNDSFEERQQKLARFADVSSNYMVKLQEAAQKCRTEDEQRYWNASSWKLGAAPTLIQKDGTSGTTEYGGATFWTSLAYGFDRFDEQFRDKKKAAAQSSLSDNSQLIIGVRYQLDQQQPDPHMVKTFFKEDSLIAGTRLRIGRPNLSVSFEGSYVYTNPEIGSTDSGYRFALGSELKVPLPNIDNVWLEASLGGTGGHGDQDRLFFLASLKIGSGKIDLTNLQNATKGVKDLIGKALVPG